MQPSLERVSDLAQNHNYRRRFKCVLLSKAPYIANDTTSLAILHPLDTNWQVINAAEAKPHGYHQTAPWSEKATVLASGHRLSRNPAGEKVTILESVVQVPGTALAIETDALRSGILRDEALRYPVLGYTDDAINAL